MPSSRSVRRGPLRGGRQAFRQWRRRRPFWGGLWAILGGAIIAYVPGTAFKFSLVPGSLIWLGVLVGVLIAVFGLFLWLQPSLRYLLGALIIVFSLGSFMSSDFGGLIIGMVLGLVAGALALAWTPLTIGPSSATASMETTSDAPAASAPIEALSTERLSQP
jgi:hypothetical protein